MSTSSARDSSGFWSTTTTTTTNSKAGPSPKKAAISSLHILIPGVDIASREQESPHSTVSSTVTSPAATQVLSEAAANLHPDFRPASAIYAPPAPVPVTSRENEADKENRAFLPLANEAQVVPSSVAAIAPAPAATSSPTCLTYEQTMHLLYPPNAKHLRKTLPHYSSRANSRGTWRTGEHGKIYSPAKQVFVKENFQGTSFQGVELEGRTFVECDLRGAMLDCRYLRGTIFINVITDCHTVLAHARYLREPQITQLHVDRSNPVISSTAATGTPRSHKRKLSPLLGQQSIDRFFGRSQPSQSSDEQAQSEAKSLRC